MYEAVILVYRIKLDPAICLQTFNMVRERCPAAKILEIMASDCNDTRFINDFKEITNGIVIAVGGDGTFATAARIASQLRYKVAGIQAGNLNFLSPFQPGLTTPFDEDVKISERVIGYCLDIDMPFINDAVFKTGRGVRAFTIKDHRDRYITSFRADGVIVATATGSTAYSLSLGGPILHPTADMFVITPIAALSLGSRPIVIPAKKISISVDEGFLNAEFDGLAPFIFSKEIDLTVGPKLKVVLPDEYNFYMQAQEKLGWYK